MSDIRYRLLSIPLNLLLKTIRFQFINSPSDFNKKVFIFWHSKMIAGWYIFGYSLPVSWYRDKKPLALVSHSKDGEILNSLLRQWNYETVRGSSSKGGKEALAELISKSKAGNPVIITPDGPRGPAKEIKNGVLIIAKENNIPIIPLSIQYSRNKILKKSWDNFEVPLPYSTCIVKFGSEHYYREFLDEDKLSEFKKNLANEMN